MFRFHCSKVAAALALASAVPAASQTLPGTPNQVQVTCSMAVGTGQCGAVLPGVPNDKLFLVQTTSVFRDSTSGTLQVYVDPMIDGTYTDYALPILQYTGTSYPGATLNTTYFIGHQGGVINVFRSSTSDTDEAFISLSGYLIPKAAQ